MPFEFFVEKWIYQVDKFESTWDSGNLVSTAITYVRLPVLVALYFPAARPVAVARFSGCFLPVYFSGTLHRTENNSFVRDSTEKYSFQHRLEQFAVACFAKSDCFFFGQRHCSNMFVGRFAVQVVATRILAYISAWPKLMVRWRSGAEQATMHRISLNA